MTEAAPWSHADRRRRTHPRSLTIPIPGPPRFPREYGAWVMVILPIALGLLAAGRVTPAAGLIVPATLLLFLGRFAAIAGGTRVTRLDAARILWTGIYFAGSAAILLGAVALASPERRADAVLLAALTGLLGASNAALVLTGRGRRLLAEILAMTAIAAAAPLVMVLAGRPLGGRVIGVGALCLAYFFSTLIFVRSHRHLRNEAARPRIVATCVVAHVLLGGALLAMARAGWLPYEALLAYVPPLIRTGTGLARPARNLRVLGWREIVVALAFIALAALGL